MDQNNRIHGIGFASGSYGNRKNSHCTKSAFLRVIYPRQFILNQREQFHWWFDHKKTVRIYIVRLKIWRKMSALQ